MKLDFRLATSGDASAIANLVNQAYRGESSRLGWTTEADLLSGLRTETAEITRLIAHENTLFLLCLTDNTLVASVCLEISNSSAHLGMFAVNPQQQARGIGKELLACAENTVVTTWGVARMEMVVITQRHELIAFYERRGYQRTGVLKPFRAASKLWQPLVGNLQLAVLEKTLT
ncbi:MAG: GNAT family N-acetyltransferase [Methylophilaceae bacterium]